MYNLFFTVFAFLLQISGIIMWPMKNIIWIYDSSQDLNSETIYSNLKDSLALPIGLVLTSFGWWESFVNEKILSKANFLWRVKINMIENGSRYTAYLIISTWKILLFFCLFILLSIETVRCLKFSK